MTTKLHNGVRQYVDLMENGEEQAMSDLFNQLAGEFGQACVTREIEECLQSLKEEPALASRSSGHSLTVR